MQDLKYRHGYKLMIWPEQNVKKIGFFKFNFYPCKFHFWIPDMGKLFTKSDANASLIAGIAA